MAHFTVFGARGYIGNHLAKHLELHGHEVTKPVQDEIPEKDLGHIIYCIGLTADYSSRPFDTVTAHVSFFAELLRKARFNSCTYLSSTRLYDSLGNTNVSEDAVLQLAPNNSRHLYDLSKALGESIGLHCGRKGVHIARLACVYGGDITTPGFIHDLVKTAKKGQFIIDSYSNLYRDYIHIDDVCQGLTHIALTGRSDIYNMASGQNILNSQIFDKLEQLLGQHFKHNGQAKSIPKTPSINIDRIRKELGLQPRALLNELSHMIRPLT